MIDKTKLKDTMGRPLTQGLFLEIGYNTDYAIYTLDDEDKEYKGKKYPSLKKLFLACGDPTEYTFAKTYLLGWNHWKRLNENKVLAEYFADWREELEVALRSEAILGIIDETTSESGGFQAKKWLADKGWDKRGAGRPAKIDKERENSIQGRIADVLDDVTRMDKFDG